MAGEGPNTLIGVWSAAFLWKSFERSKPASTMTTSKRFALRTKDHSDERVLDARVKAVLNALHAEPRGRALEAYLRATGRMKR